MFRYNGLRGKIMSMRSGRTKILAELPVHQRGVFISESRNPDNLDVIEKKVPEWDFEAHLLIERTRADKDCMLVYLGYDEDIFRSDTHVIHNFGGDESLRTSIFEYCHEFHIVDYWFILPIVTMHKIIGNYVQMFCIRWNTSQSFVSVHVKELLRLIHILPKEEAQRTLDHLKNTNQVDKGISIEAISQFVFV